jgi:hypothetical protein
MNLRLFEKQAERKAQAQLETLPSGIRGIYVLYKQRRKVRSNGKPCFDVVYVGLATRGAKGRLRETNRKRLDCGPTFQFSRCIRTSRMMKLQNSKLSSDTSIVLIPAQIH